MTPTRRAWYLLLLLPFAATLLPWIYNRAAPSWLGMPFFYWYQLAAIVGTTLLLALVVYLTREDPDV